MTKAEIVAIMAKTAGGSKTSAERAMNAFVCGIVESLRRQRVGQHQRAIHPHIRQLAADGDFQFIRLANLHRCPLRR